VIHFATCRRVNEITRRVPISTGEVVVTTSCRSCRMAHEHVADRGDLDVNDQPEPRPTRRGWPWPPDAAGPRSRSPAGAKPTRHTAGRYATDVDDSTRGPRRAGTTSSPAAPPWVRIAAASRRTR
jgi:hypothetical protein